MVIDEPCKAYRKDNREMKAAFEAAARACNIALEAREMPAARASPKSRCSMHALPISSSPRRPT
jgi:hypothetical protein